MDVDILDKARNIAIALGGMVGISKIQWKALADAFVEFYYHNKKLKLKTIVYDHAHRI